MTYTPRPLDTTTVELPERLNELVELLAENAHDTWAQMRIADGWRYGPRRDDAARTHPDLVPYAELPDSEQQYDRELAVTTLKVVLGQGYRIVRS
jgi:hypothetical protein